MAEVAQISPSILSADFARLGEDVRDVCGRGIDYLHIDIMDGAFVPNISFGAAVMKSLNGIATVPYDVHLMIEAPDRYIEDFVTDNTEFITVHYEACSDLSKTIRHIHESGVKAGVSIKPETDPEVLDPYLKDIDLILVMSVAPGFGNQKFIETAYSKLRYYSERREAEGLSYLIEVDGGIRTSNSEAVRAAGTDILVAGSAVFKAEDRTKVIEAIKGL